MSFICYDIETRPDEARALAAFRPEKVKVGNLKDPEKIEAKVEQARAEAVEKAALSPETGSVVAIGYSRGVGCDILGRGKHEDELLIEFWELFREGATFVNWTGSNGKGNFDRKFLIRRSWALDIEIPEAAFEHSRWLDVAQRFLIAEDYGTFFGLERAARELGFMITPTDPVNGANFHLFWESDDDEAVRLAEAYLRQDVTLLGEIFAICYPELSF